MKKSGKFSKPDATIPEGVSQKKRKLKFEERVVVVDPLDPCGGLHGVIEEEVLRQKGSILRVRLDNNPEVLMEFRREQLYREELPPLAVQESSSSGGGVQPEHPPSSSLVQPISRGPPAFEVIDSTSMIEQLNAVSPPENENLRAVPDADPSIQPRDPRLKPHKLLWNDLKSERVDIVRDSLDANNRPQLNWLHLFKNDLDRVPLPQRTAKHYFMLMFPKMQLIDPLIALTNQRLNRKGHRSLLIDEFWVYIGLRLMIAHDKINDPSTGWHTTTQENDYHLPADFTARFGMPRDRFKEIDESLCWSKEDKNDLWWRVRSLVDAFNDRMKDVITPGDVLVVDELFSMWYGKKALPEDIAAQCDDRFQRCPHCSFMKDKPRGEGVMFKCLSDGWSKIMLKLEIQEGQREMEFKDFQMRDEPFKFKDANDRAKFKDRLDAGDLHQYHTAVTLRLVDHFFNSGKVVVGDSAFGSVATIVSLLLKGLYFVGTIKTAVTNFPLQFFKDWSAAESTSIGSFHVLTTKVHHIDNPGVPREIMAVGYKGGDSFLRTIGTSIGSTKSGDSVSIKNTVLCRHDREVDFMEVSSTVEQPKVIEEFHHYAHAVDIHNQLRQGILRIEEFWHTQRYWVRVFSIILGIVCVNAYFAYQLEHDEVNPRMPFDQFMNHLICELCMTNPSASKAFHRSSSSSVAAATVDLSEHHARSLVEHPFYAKTKQSLKEAADHAVSSGETQEQIELALDRWKHYHPKLTCTVCNDAKCRATAYCVDCTGPPSANSHKGIVAVHIGKSSKFSEIDHKCWRKHIGHDVEDDECEQVADEEIDLEFEEENP